MKRPPRTAVALARTVAPCRAPKAVWLPPPPNALAMSPLALLEQDDDQERKQTRQGRDEVVEHNGQV